MPYGEPYRLRLHHRPRLGDIAKVRNGHRRDAKAALMLRHDERVGGE
jgi:hypothetical protein